jgi:predicted alpha-1,6-mannanase (GH76 family)
LPAYFKLRKTGELRAQLVATVLVFLVTWALHIYQFFWLQGTIRVTWNDTLFWTILGLLVVANVWIDAKKPKRVPQSASRQSASSKSGVSSKVVEALQIVATMSGLMLLWSLWSFNSLAEWVNFLKTGNL